MINISIRTLFIVSFSLLLFISCNPDQTPTPNEILASDDPRIGEAIDTEFHNHADTAQDFAILDRAAFWKVYNYADSIFLKLLNSYDFQYASEFNWTIRVFDKAGLETAFALPGGYLYLSKDLLVFLENEAEFSAILAHEMIVSDSRAITNKLEEEFSISYLLDIALGGQVEAAEDVLQHIMYESFEETTVKEIDQLSRNVICQSDYDIRSYSSFASRAVNDGNIEWLALYPYSSNWVNDLYNSFDVNNCAGELQDQVSYEKIKMLLVK